jgi:hypothetical protein
VNSGIPARSHLSNSPKTNFSQILKRRVVKFGLAGWIVRIAWRYNEPFRAVERPTYEEMMVDQIDAAIAKSGPGSLEKLINSGDTWIVE